jgi:hypothetical protein
MPLETYGFVLPLALIGLSGFGWAGLWFTRRHSGPGRASVR